MRFTAIAAWLGTMLVVTAPLFGFDRFDLVPRVYASDIDRFAELFRSAETGTVRLGVLGDSQETSPGGGGIQYVPHLTHGFWERFGNIPETEIASNVSEIELIHRSASAGGAPSRIPTAYLPPGVTAKAHSALGAVNAAGSDYGTLFVLQHDGVETHATGLRGGAYMDVSAGVRLQVFAATNASSGEVAWRTMPRDAAGPSYFEPVVQSGISAVGLESGAHAIKSFMTPTLSFDGKRYLQAEVFGTEPTKVTDVIGARFVSNNSVGVAVQDFSDGGYRASTIVGSHGEAGDFFVASDADVYLLHYGANDSGASAAEFKANTLALIAQLRSWHNDDSLPIILAGDPDRAGLTAAQRNEFDQFAGAQYEIAQADPNVLLINSRLLAHEAGWYESSATFEDYVIDGVHYTEAGGRLLAQLEVNALFTSVPEPTFGMSGLLLTCVLALQRRHQH